MMLQFGIIGRRCVSYIETERFEKNPRRLIMLFYAQTHTASYGFAPHRRHAVRVAAQAERPVLEEEGKSQEEEICALYGLPAVNKDGSRQSNYND